MGIPSAVRSWLLVMADINCRYGQKSAKRLEKMWVTQAKTTTFNHVIVSRSTDLGKSWTASLVFADPRLVNLGRVFPALAVDQVIGKLYAVWSDAHNTFFASSSDHGST